MKTSLIGFASEAGLLVALCGVAAVTVLALPLGLAIRAYSGLKKLEQEMHFPHPLRTI